MHLTHGRTAAHALVAQVGGAHPMQLQQIGLGIPQAARRGHLGPIAAGPQTAQQPRFGATLQGGE
jgi:hypothetical protein